MSRVSTYLNFSGQSEEALTHYRDLFGTQFVGPIVRFEDVTMPGAPAISPDDARKIMHRTRGGRRGVGAAATGVGPVLVDVSRSLRHSMDDRRSIG